jgi:hypothetical protein
MKMPPIVLDKILSVDERDFLCSMAHCDHLKCEECALYCSKNNEQYLEETRDESDN